MDSATSPDHPSDGQLSRRRFLRYSTTVGALAAGAPALPALLGGDPAMAETAAGAAAASVPSFKWEEATIAELQAVMQAGTLTSHSLVDAYIHRIRQIDLAGIQLNSVIEVNPDALATADGLDRERRASGPRGPLHGIPIIVKDNYATDDQMETTAGSLALLGSRVPRDAFVVKGLRDAGAVILGKANLSEWANFRSFQSSSGWSGRAGQCLNPYVLDHNPCGSSSGSGAAAAANLAAATLGTADSQGHSFKDYRQFLDPDGLRGARIGVWREGVFGISPEGDAVAEAAISQMSRLGATIVDPADIANVNDVGGPEFTVLLFEFKVEVAKYLSELSNTSMRTLADLIAFNDAHADQEMPWFGQEIFLLAEQTDGLDDPEYKTALATSKQLMQDGINGVLSRFDLDAIMSLTGSPPWTTDLVNGDHFLTASSTPAAVAGYPNITVPAGFSFGELPVGINFIGGQWAEPTLIKLASGFEQGTKARHAPKFLASLGVRDFVPRDTGVRGGSGARAQLQADLKAQPARRNPVAGSL